MASSGPICVYALILLATLFNFATCRKATYSNTWVIQVDGGRKAAERIAAEKDLTLLGQVGSLEGFYMYEHNSHPRRSRRAAEDLTSDISENPNVVWADQQIVKRRVKRDYNPRFMDPDYHKQWYLHNTDSVFKRYDHNVLPVWEQGVTGKGVVVSILDDGIEYTHNDLKANYEQHASYDYNSNDADPAPRATWNDENRHGTRCAGEVAATANNSFCGVGVAPGSKVGGVRMLDGDVTDAVEAASLSLNPQDIDVYSSSWGPDDDGRTVDGPAKLARKAFSDGIQNGRGGLGSIYVWASGNGGRSQDSCSCDGYTNSIYTLSISSATEHGTSPWYSEYCASTMATTFSSGSYDMRKIVTTDLHGKCTDSHTGTSASAPLAAGILALALEVNRNLTWRDMQHLVVRTSSNVKLKSDDFVVNAVGRKVSHKFGYGLLDAFALVNLARKWKTVPPQHICDEMPEPQKRPIPGTGTLTLTVETGACSHNNHYIKYLEHVQVIMSLTYTRRGDLTIKLISPRGTVAVLLPQRRQDSGSSFTDWEFMSTHTWGEDPKGTWTIELENRGSSGNSGTLTKWYLQMYGTADPPQPSDSTKKPVTACSIECQSGCTGPRPDQCNECKHFRRSTNNECVAHCLRSEYQDVAGKLCKPCSGTCESCNGSSSVNCLSCNPPLILNNGSCVISCPDGKFVHAQDSALVCSKCDTSCLTCAGNATSCTSCSMEYTYEPGKCVKKCAEGQYADSNGQCQLCHPSCLTCNGGSASSCTECGTKDHHQLLFLHKGECQASCPSAFYGDTGNQECKPCDATCSSCSGPSSSECTSCSQGRFLFQNGLCLLHCPEGHYPEPINKTCTPCSSSCKQCNPLDPNKCTSCPSGNFLFHHECLSGSQCPEGTYANTTTQTCKNCPVGCTSCTSESDLQCLGCSRGFVLYKAKCLMRCPEGTFPLHSNSCVPCDSTCQTCFGDRSNQCLSCKSPRLRLGSSCLADCPNGTFHSQVTRTCEACHTVCETCSGPTISDCESCKAGWSLVGKTCDRVCPSGKFNGSGGCQPCHPTCLVCNGPTHKNCLSCSDIKFLNMETKQCSFDCPKGYFGDLGSTHCKPCSPGCKKCKNEEECLLCQSGLLLVGNSCQMQCPSGQFRTKTNSCEPCDRMCKECTMSASHCIKCQGHEVLSEGHCVSICPVGTFLQLGTKNCMPCHPSCKTCTGPGADDCTGCKDASVMAKSRCLASCPSDYYFDKEANRCQPCDYYCSTCSGGNGLKNCTKCVPPFVLYEHYCIRECPKHGWVLDSNRRECVKCHPSCGRCIGPTANDCIACSNPEESLVGFSCMKDCPHGTFPNQVTGVCERCHPTCETCSGSGVANCVKCAKDLTQNKSTGMCTSVCSEGQYALEEECTNCSSNCRTCNGPGSVNCLSCPDSKVLNNFTCIDKCPAGTYAADKDGGRQCIQCHPVCDTCYGPSMDNCLVCKNPLFIEGRLCVIQCSPGHVLNEQQRSCHPCRNCRVPAKAKNRSIDHPNDERLQYVVKNSQQRSLLVIVIAAGSISTMVFLVVFGLLQFHSKRKMRYTIIKANFRSSKIEDEDECHMSLMGGEQERT